MAKTFDELHNERFGYNAASCTGYCANESKYSTYQYRCEGYFLREAEVTALQAKLLEAQAACAEMQSILRTSLVIPRAWMRGHITFEQWDKACQKVFQAIDTPNPGALLLARLKAADELAEASAQILRACASSVPHVFSNAQFILGEKLAAYETTKEAK